ncbi:M14 family metallopeptidase [Piscinibacter sp. XHJ-5]|uniref:M14 family metallopeptidase n=1 Tax=Piscinibacter sp. XHJ-5 TaxID=3037797 RepID=UPI0024536F98|nr:M14 family metallopeptidase [Piscinibacter sp. XHJ-5]
MDVSGHFAQTYAEARAKFLASCEAAGIDVEAHVHPMLGRDGETLAMDVALDGSRDARRLLLITSACHGVEGFCGSGIQNALLHDARWRQQASSAAVAVLYIHGLNPYGFSWWRRVTQENVDLNRNFHDFTQPLPSNPAYDEIAPLLVPTTWPPSPEANARVTALIEARGIEAVQAATSSGQYDHPEGLFYGGRNPTWSNQTLRQVLRDHGRRCDKLGWIDLHTGLGPSGHGERIFACRDDAAALARARAWWGPEVTSIYDGSSTSALLTGMMWLAAYDECPQAEYTGIALEYGTLPILDVINALRGDQWLENHPEAPAPLHRFIKQQLRDAFYTDDDAWKQRVVEQGVEAARQAVSGLRGSP